MSFAGAHTALVTPFRDGQFDIPAFKSLIEEQIAGGISGIIPVGTTGESPTLDHDEHLSVIQVAIETAAGRCKVIAGTGSNSTAEAIDLTQAAEKAGADAALLVAPYYNKPSPRASTATSPPSRKRSKSRSFFTASPAVAASRSLSKRPSALRAISKTSSPSRKPAAASSA